MSLVHILLFKTPINKVKLLVWWLCVFCLLQHPLLLTSVSLSARTDDEDELSHLRNAPQAPGHLHFSSAYKDLCGTLSVHPPRRPLICHPSVHLPVRPWRKSAQPTDMSRHHAESFPTSFPPKAVRRPSQSLECHRLNSSCKQSEESGSCPISLHYGTAVQQRCHVPVVVQGRRCLIHHQNKETGWGRGGVCVQGVEVGSSCPTHTDTHLCTYIFVRTFIVIILR